jgi:hypothetical protein
MIFWKGSQLPREFAEAFFYPLLADAPRREMAFNAMDVFAGRHPEIEPAWQGIRERLTHSPLKRTYDAAVMSRPGGGRDRRYAGLFPFTGQTPKHAELESSGTEDVRLDFASVRQACEDLLALREDLMAFVEHLPSRPPSSSAAIPALGSDTRSESSNAHPATA